MFLRKLIYFPFFLDMRELENDKPKEIHTIQPLISYSPKNQIIVPNSLDRKD